MFRVCLRALIFLIFLVPIARAGSIALLLSQEGGPYAEFASAFQRGLEGSSWTVIASGTQPSLDPAQLRADLIVTAGANALRQTLARNGTTPVLATLLPRQAYEKILAEAGRPRPRVSAIYLDQPPGRQLAFLRQLLPEHKRVGMLLSSETRALYAQYRQVFSSAKFTMSSEEMDSDSQMVATLGNLLPRIDVLLAIPDSTIYKRDNIRPILVTSYRYQRPVVAFSAALVSAGALAALYSTPTQIASQAADTIKLTGSNLPAPQGPDMFAISINRNVADALNLSVPDEALIRRAMLAERESR